MQKPINNKLVEIIKHKSLVHARGYHYTSGVHVGYTTDALVKDWVMRLLEVEQAKNNILQFPGGMFAVEYPRPESCFRMTR